MLRSVKAMKAAKVFVLKDFYPKEFLEFIYTLTCQ